MRGPRDTFDRFQTAAFGMLFVMSVVGLWFDGSLGHVPNIVLTGLLTASGMRLGQ